MTLDQLAKKHDAYELVDKSPFQRKARILQSIWRQREGLKIGEHKGKDGATRKLGSRLPMPDAQEHLWNFLSDNIKAVVRDEVLNPAKAKGKLFGRPRFFNDLLSSQPLCFNLFAELQRELGLATAVLSNLIPGRIERVTSIDFEYSPGRGDPRYTGDKTAFDVFVQFTGPADNGFVGIEVKYHENLICKTEEPGKRRAEIAQQMECFRADVVGGPTDPLLQQIWRDHLLAGALKHVDNFADGFFLFLYPEQNPHCRDAVARYRECLSDDRSFASSTLEQMVTEIRRHTSPSWVDRLFDRYLNFGKIEAALNGDADPKWSGTGSVSA